VDIVQVILLFSAFLISVMRTSMELYGVGLRKYLNLAQMFFIVTGSFSYMKSIKHRKTMQP